MNLLTALFDLRFDRLISRSLLGVVYAIALGLHLLTGVAVLLSFLASGAIWMVLVGVLIVPAVTVLGALLLRLLFEALAAYFRMADDVQALRVQPSYPPNA